MKPITKKLIESGLLDKHTIAMMQKWGQWDDGTIEMTGGNKQTLKEMTEDQLEEFAEELEELLEQKSEVRETRLEIQIKETALIHDSCGRSQEGHIDLAGNIIVPMPLKIRVHRGTLIQLNHQTYVEVLDMDPVYQNDEMVALQLTVHKQSE